MAKIAGTTIIGRPAVGVFNCAADQRNEPPYNPRMILADKVGDGPVGKGTVFHPVLGGTRMRWSWTVRPKGAARLLRRVVTWIGRRQEEEHALEELCS